MPTLCVNIVLSHCIMSLYNGFFVCFQCLFVDLCHLYTSVFLLLKIKESWVLSPESCNGNYIMLRKFALSGMKGAERSPLVALRYTRCLFTILLVSGVPDLWDRTRILICDDLSHLPVPDYIWVFFYCLFLVYSSQYSFYFNYVLIVTFWIFTYHKIWILLNI